MRALFLLAIWLAASPAFACSCQHPEFDPAAVIEGRVISRQMYILGVPIPDNPLAAVLSFFLPAHGTAVVKVDREIVGEDSPSFLFLVGRIGDEASCRGSLPDYGQVTYFSHRQLGSGTGGFGYCSGLRRGTYADFLERMARIPKF